MSTHSFQKSDVYSFAIVAQEILFRAGPFPLVDGVEITFKGRFLLYSNNTVSQWKIIRADKIIHSYSFCFACF